LTFNNYIEGLSNYSSSYLYREELVKMTEWRAIKGYEGLYEVSDTGLVRSLDRTDRLNRFKRGAIKATCDNGRGYLCVNLKANGKQAQKTVHRLVATAFIANPDNLPEVNHIDGNKVNNSVSNLEWCNRADNLKHAFKNGLNKQCKGLDNKQHTLSKEAVIFIRNNAKPYDKNYSYAELARKFNVSEPTIKKVAWGKSYVNIF
jgi:hypothetical protein